MSVSFPEGVSADGNVKVVFVPAIADTTEPTVTEVTATGTLDISCFLTTFAANGEAQTVEDIRLCSRQVFEDYGSIAHTLDDLEYVIDPQDTTPTGGNAAALTLTPGTQGFLVVRYGAAYEDALASGDVVDVYPVKAGPQIKVAPERNTKLKARQKLFVNGPARMDVALTT